MSVCHSLTIISGELAGDPLDLIMFRGTGWSIQQPEQYDNLQCTTVRSPSSPSAPDYEYGVVRDFPFASARQCQSVVVRRAERDHFTVFCKGSPEKVAALAEGTGTLPGDFRQTLERSAHKTLVH